MFCSLRNTKSIISDNFKIFKTVEIRDFIQFNRIQWSLFSKSPVVWGFYERLVGVIKKCLKKVVVKAKLEVEF